MGGEAAKERRRLKRLQALQGADGTAVPSGDKPGAPGAESKPNDEKSGSPQQTKAHGERNSAEAVRLRLQRKMARKARGKFKPQMGSAPPPSTSDHDRKRKSNDGQTTKSPRPSSKIPKRSPGKDQSFQRKSRTKNKFRKPKENGPAKKSNGSKHKAKNKPKHLKRKMEQLSTTISEGNNGSNTNISLGLLEGQMKQLVAQMEEYKKLKQNNAANATEGKIATIDEVKEGDYTGKDNSNDDAVGDDANKKEKESDTDIEENQESGPSVPADKEPSNSDDKETNESVQSSSSSSSSEDDEDSDEDDITDSYVGRSRGKRRRGRRGSKPNDSDVASDGNSETESNVVAPELTQEEIDKDASDTTQTSSTATKKTPKKDDNRRCIGRKPVTDYSIGKIYSGKVRYIKPKLGAFIDIGCHSDAFCHISCISDEFVSSVDDVLKVDGVVDNVRVVEINREKKRITVSLRTEEVAENEVKRLKATRQYEKGVHSSHNGHNDSSNGDSKKSPKSRHIQFDAPKPNVSVQTSESANDEHAPFAPKAGCTIESHAKLKRERKLARRAERREQKAQLESSPANDSIDIQGQSTAVVRSTTGMTGQKSGADLKRERKLARRAERRAAREAAAN